MSTEETSETQHQDESTEAVVADKSVVTDAQKDDMGTQIQAAVKAAVADIKTKLDTAYSSRDKALEEVASFKQKDSAAKIKALEEEGKHKEAYELQLAEKDAEIAVLNTTVLSLTRDNSLRSALSEHTFKSTRASNIAFRELSDILIKDKDGKWVDARGNPMAAAVAAFVADPDNALLMKTKSQSGSGISANVATNNSPADTSKGSVFKMSQADVLKRASARLNK